MPSGLHNRPASPEIGLERRLCARRELSITFAAVRGSRRRAETSCPPDASRHLPRAWLPLTSGRQSLGSRCFEWVG